MTNLLLDSLEIKNFRAFKHLRIEQLGRVNLIVGKNNVGKTSVLEALRLYAERGSISLIWELIEQRDESSRIKRLSNIRVSEDKVLSLRHLFYGRENIRQYSPQFQVGSSSDREQMMTVAIQWLKASGSNGEEEILLGNASPTLVVTYGDNPSAMYRLANSGLAQSIQNTPNIQITHQYISALGSNAIDIANLWDQIALTDSEEDILIALRLISPNIERLNLVAIGEDSRTRVPVVRLSGQSTPIPLRSMGEGMNRMLGIALSLVNARDGFLLVDEIESGLHYSVQADMWRLIFEMAHRLNVQVFATTHSLDCIRAFQYAANENTDEVGMLIRLAQRGKDIIATSFDEDKLAIIARDEIEVR